tara:strand:- start:1544 stop:1771 length:228 start_codon:yes stop_codon:yes gene_type:complete
VKVNDLVKWTWAEEAYHTALRAPGIPNYSEDRRCGIIVDKNPTYFFVFWQNGDLIAQKPNTIEVINSSKTLDKTT